MLRESDPTTMGGVYFCGATILTATFAVAWIVLPRHRGGALLSACALGPCGFLGYVFVPGYWRPDHWFEIVPGVGVEDFLICFSEGGLAWIAARLAARSTDEPSADLRPSTRFLLRLAAIGGAGGTLSLMGRLAGLDVMTAIVVGFSIVGVAVLACQGRSFARAALGGLLFATVHVAVGVTVLVVRPDAATFWSDSVARGVSLLGLPLEEIAWAVTFGAAWPTFVSFAAATSAQSIPSNKAEPTRTIVEPSRIAAS